MIFDDHDVRDDWNASLDWKKRMKATSWWQKVASSPGWRRTRCLSASATCRPENAQPTSCGSGSAGTTAQELDLSDALDEFADRCDKDPNSYRWSYRRDFDDVRLIVVDSRVAKIFTPSARGVLNAQELAWFDDQMQGEFGTSLVASSLPFLLPLGLHHVEAWDEAISSAGESLAAGGGTVAAGRRP